MVSRSPLIGAGAGTFSWVRLDAPPAEASRLAVRLVHNVPLQTLVDGGLVLATAILVGTSVWAHTVWSRRGLSSADRAGVASAAGLVAAVFLDDFSYLPAITAVGLTIAALMAPAPRDDRTTGRRYLIPAVLGFAALIAAPNVIAVDIARTTAQSARAAMVRADFDAAVADFTSATRWHPHDGGYWLGLGMANAYAGDIEGSALAYRRATEVAPGDPRGYAALAAFEDGEAAAELLQRAADLTLGDPEYAVRLGLAVAAAGQPDAAALAWGRAVALRPELLGALPYPEVGITLGDVAAAAVREIHVDRRPSRAADQEALWEIELALDQLSPDAGPAWLAVDAARHGDIATATRMANAAVDESPWTARGYQAQAAVAAFACDPDPEREALDRERASGDGFGEPAAEPQIRREFVYREAGLGPSQPPGARVELSIERWPWSLIDRPACSP